MSAFFKQLLYELEDVIDDDVAEFQSQLDYHDMGYSEKEEKLLGDAFIHKDGIASIAKRFSNVITSINKLEDKHIDATGFMSVYSQGKMAKSLNYLARLENWERLLKLTQPES